MKKMALIVICFFSSSTFAKSNLIKSNMKKNTDELTAFAFRKDPTYKTKALLISRGNKIIYEKYSQGISPDSPLPVQSAGNIILNIAVGFAKANHFFDERKNLFSEYPNMPKEWSKLISLDHLMRFSSGLRYYNDHESEEKSNLVLWNNEETSKSDLQKKYAEFLSLQLYPPGTTFNFSFIDRNLATLLIKKSFVKISLENFIQEKLIKELKLNNTTFRFQENSGFANQPIINKSIFYVESTARDLAKLVSLYTNEGKFNKKTYFNKDWLTYSWQVSDSQITMPPGRTTIGTESYGAYWFLNKRFSPYYDLAFKNLPESLVLIRGLKGQMIAIFPEKKMFIIRIADDSIGGIKEMNDILTLANNLE